jgi:hypothetical protein
METACARAASSSSYFLYIRNGFSGIQGKKKKKKTKTKKVATSNDASFYGGGVCIVFVMNDPHSDLAVTPLISPRGQQRVPLFLPSIFPSSSSRRTRQLSCVLEEGGSSSSCSFF